MLSEVKKLDERKKKVLQAIVEEYVNTAEPVSSNLLTQKDELNNYSDKIDEFAINPNNIIVNVIDLFRDEDVSKVISNKYRLNNINLDETSLAKDELNALVEKIDFILRIETIENSNLDVHKLWFISEVAKIDRA